MTCEELLQALALTVGTLFPTCKVYHGEIPQGADGNFSISITNIAQSKGLGQRYHRTVGMEVRYFLASRAVCDYVPWAETMLDGVRVLSNGQWRCAVLNPVATKDTSGNFYRFAFDVTLCFTEAPEPAEVMESLYQTQQLILTKKGE